VTCISEGGIGQGNRVDFIRLDIPPLYILFWTND